MNVPNILTMLRFVLIGVFVYLFVVPANYVAALLVFLLAALTDVLDGYIARKYNLITDFGKLMDPLADKLMLIAALACLSRLDRTMYIFLAFVLLKELLMVAGGVYLYRHKVVVYAKLFGKMSTFAFNLGVALTVLSLFITPVKQLRLHVFFLTIAVILAAIAFVQYAMVFAKAPKDGLGDNKVTDGSGFSLKTTGSCLKTEIAEEIAPPSSKEKQH